MPKLILSDVDDLQDEESAITTLSNNNAATEEAFENTLSRDGTSPNNMNADLDMNSYRILNLPDALNDQEPITLGQLTAAEASVGGAPSTAQYLVLSANAGLSAERVFTVGSGLAGVNLGPNSTYTLSVDINGLTTLVGSVDNAADYMAIYDASTSSLRKTLLGSIFPPPAALTKTDDTNVTLTLGGTPATALLQATSLTLGWTGTLALSRLAQGTDGQLIVGQTSSASLYKTITGDWTISAAGAATLATVNAGSSGTFGTATQVGSFTVNTKGLITAASSVTITPAVGSITGLGTGVATFLATPTSANLQAALTDETGTGAAVFGTSPGFTTAANPVSSDGAALGTTALMWSDLFLASGGVINFNAGNYTVTHSAGLLAFNGNILLGASSSSVTGQLVQHGGTNINLALGAWASGPLMSAVNDANSAYVGLHIDSLSVILGGAGTASTSTTSGQLVVTGGVGVSGSVVAAGMFASTLNVNGASGAYNLDDRTGGGSHAWAIYATGNSFRLFSVNGSADRLTIDDANGLLSLTGGVVSAHPTAGQGYSTGAGGTATQGTSRTTGVTLNRVCGAITLFSQINTAISGATAQSFTVTNAAVAATDVIKVSQKSGSDKYLIFVTNTSAGSFQITSYTTGGTSNEAPVFNFTVTKAVTS